MDMLTSVYVEDRFPDGHGNHVWDDSVVVQGIPVVTGEKSMDTGILHGRLSRNARFEELAFLRTKC